MNRPFWIGVLLPVAVIPPAVFLLLCLVPGLELYVVARIGYSPLDTLPKTVLSTFLGYEEEDPVVQAWLQRRVRLSVPTVPDEPALRHAIRDMYQDYIPRLTAQQIEEFRNDGVVLVENVLPNREIVDIIRRRVEMHRWDSDTIYRVLCSLHKFNGAIRDLFHEVPFKQLVAPLLNAEPNTTTIENGPKVWHWPGSQRPQYEMNWHSEDWRTDKHPHEFVVVWLALSDAPHAMEFLSGHQNETRDAMVQCKQHESVRPYDDMMDKLDTGECIKGTAIFKKLRQLSADVGGERFGPPVKPAPGVWMKDAKAGDALIWHGAILHRGLSQMQRRTSLGFHVQSQSPQDLDGQLEERSFSWKETTVLHKAYAHLH